MFIETQNLLFYVHLPFILSFNSLIKRLFLRNLILSLFKAFNDLHI